MTDREEHAELDVADRGRAAGVARGADGRRATAGARARPARPQPRDRPLGGCGRATAGKSALARVGRVTPARSFCRPRLARQPRGAGADGGAPCSARCGSGGPSEQPVLIVIDEAHNVCPSRAARRADGGGRPSTRCGSRPRAASSGSTCSSAPSGPQKVQENIISQCDNLVLMRMASSRRPRATSASCCPTRRAGCSTGATHVPARRGAGGREARLSPRADPVRQAAWRRREAATSRRAGPPAFS